VKPRALDLFCGAGGAAAGMIAAGFDVFGVDRDHRCARIYPGTFVRGDAVNPPFKVRDFDFIWASPPCQAFSMAAAHGRGRSTVNLIPAVRSILEEHPYTCIENVAQAPLRPDLELTGPMVGLPDIQRRRRFELSFYVMAPAKRNARRPSITVLRANAVRWNGSRFAYVDQVRAREAMGVSHGMSVSQLGEAVPPPYAHLIASQALAAMRRVQ